MGVKQRGCIKQLASMFNWTNQEETLEKTKAYNIPKQLFVTAYRLVKANAGSSGVDRQTLSDFEKDLVI